LLWQRDDVTHRHGEFSKSLDVDPTIEEDNAFRERFTNLLVAGWPGSEPLKYVRRVPDTHLLEPVTEGR
jgi:hypothetical protein